MSPEDYRQATTLRRALYRLYRSPFGSFPYYFLEIWLRRSVAPLSADDRREWRKHAFDTVFILAGNALLVASVLWASARLAPGRPAWLAVVLGWIVPFLSWNWIIGWVVFMQHTHPEVGWYATRAEWTFFRGQILGTVQATFPPVMDTFSNHIMKHHAHHASPTIPLYRLARAQALLLAAYPEVKALMLTPRTLLRHLRACKLFDYERRQWVDFDGNPTGPVIPLDGGPPPPVGPGC
jgi:omega-6 fatty acid desaturase (delta-12 desaturase)